MAEITDMVVPDYEVKLLMKPEQVLGPDGKLIDSVLSEFGISSKSKKMSIQFIDTDEQIVYTNGWNLRIRKSEKEDKFGLTYKKRFPVDTSDDANPGSNISHAVMAAYMEGFSSSSPFEAQVEVGYRKQTLSISHNVEIPADDADAMDLPEIKDSCDSLTENSPDSFNSWSVSTQDSETSDLLANAITYGPVKAKRFKGTWGEFKLFVELWPIRTSKSDGTLLQTVEASFKTDDMEKALEGRDKLAELLQSKGWLLAEDSLKTKLIMDRYGNV